MELTFWGFDPWTAPIALQEIKRPKPFDYFVTTQKGGSIAEGFHSLHMCIKGRDFTRHAPIGALLDKLFVEQPWFYLLVEQMICRI